MTACGANEEGSQRYNSSLKIMEFCDGVAWQSFGGSGSIPPGAIMAFDLTTCPSGWSEYTAARGRFLRGIDNGAGNDPAGTRSPGNVQDDAFQGHWHSLPNNVMGRFGSSDTIDTANSNSSYVSNTTDPISDGVNGAPRTAPETRPKNVAVLFCRKN